jgi:excisionase family DNA binding protein
MAFLNVKQVAEKLGLTEATIREGAKRGRIPGGRRIGGRWLFHEQTLLKYFESATIPDAPSVSAA